MRNASPLRYPGGKSCLHGLVSTILRQNRLDRGHYVEPYAGGCGLALALLFNGNVGDVYLNDLDPAVWAFWESVLTFTEEIASMIRTVPVTVEEWHKQKAIHRACDRSDVVSLGFATFFLNRTNRSGVIKGAGVIGGLSQTGNYKIDCRFNRDDLVRRVRRVAKYKTCIHFFNKDALDFMSECDSELPRETFFCIDPPYFNKGSSLYTNFYGPSEHGSVARAILKLKKPWIVTYDCANEIKDLYSKRRQYAFDINYSVQTKRVGLELLIASSRLRIPTYLSEQAVNAILSAAA